MNYKHLYFTDPTFDIADVLASKGTTVAIGSSTILWATNLGAFGGDTSGLDCTPLASQVHLEKAGVEQQEKWAVDYIYNHADFNAMETLKGATTSSTITVTLPNGATFTNTGKVASNYVDAVGVEEIIKAHASIELSSAWTYTAPSSGG